jgi:hypothetical protein
MPGDLPPLPWSYQMVCGDETKGTGFLYLLDANGRKIGTLWGRPKEKIAAAEFICDLTEGLKSVG